MKRLVEIRSYALKPGTADRLHETFVARVLPMLRDAGIDVVAFGRSMYDENAWYLVRAFDDFAHLNAQEDAFYGSDAWKNGPRAAVVDAIDRYLDTLLWMSDESIDDLRDSNSSA
jgi:hypothetical protein